MAEEQKKDFIDRLDKPLTEFFNSRAGSALAVGVTALFTALSALATMITESKAETIIGVGITVLSTKLTSDSISLYKRASKAHRIKKMLEEENENEEETRLTPE